MYDVRYTFLFLMVLSERKILPCQALLRQKYMLVRRFCSTQHHIFKSTTYREYLIVIYSCLLREQLRPFLLIAYGLPENDWLLEFVFAFVEIFWNIVGTHSWLFSYPSAVNVLSIFSTCPTWLLLSNLNCMAILFDEIY